MDLTGVWVGETLRAATLSHHWIIVQNGLSLDIYTRWENANSFASDGIFKGTVGTANLFTILRAGEAAYGEILNEDYFKVIQWIDGLFEDGKRIPYFDVLFQRRKLGLEQFEVEFLMQLYDDKSVIKRFSDLPYA